MTEAPARTTSGTEHDESGSALGLWRLAVASAFALGGLFMAAWGPRLPTIKTDLGLDDAALGLLVVASTVSAVAGLASSSTLYRRFGARRSIPLLLSISSLGLAVVGFGAGVLESPVVVVLGFIGIGFGIGAVDVMMNVEGSELERASSRVLMPFLHACWSGGAVIGAGIGAICAGLDIAPQWQFLGTAIFGAIAINVLGRFIPAHAPAPATESVPLGARLRRVLAGWKDRRLLVIGIVMLGVELAEGSANNWLTLGASQGHGQTAGVAAAFFVVFAASEMTFRIVGGPIVERIGRVRIVQLTAALGVVGLLIFILPSPPWLIVVGIALWAIGASMGFPLGMSAAAESGPNPSGRVSVVASVGYLANLAGPPAIGLLSQGVGLLNAFWLVLILMLAALLAAPALAPVRGAAREG